VIFFAMSSDYFDTAKYWEKHGWDSNCGCGRHIAAATAWVCGRCEEVNNPTTSRMDLLPHLLYRCCKCRWAPTAITCPECQVAIQLGPEPVFRPARVWKEPDKKTVEIERMEQQLKKDKVRMEIEAEKNRLIRQYRAKELAVDIRELFERLGTAKEFEREALKQMMEFKESGWLRPNEEARIMEFIEDKVLEAINVARRGRQTRPFSE
jgi:hypothetical protein